MLYVMAACLAFLLHSCSADENFRPVDTSDLTSITMQVRSAGIPVTRAGGDGSVTRETRIDNLSVLVFRNDNGNETFAYKANVRDITYTGQGLYELTVRLRKSMDNEAYSLVLIANHALTSSMANAAGTPKATMLNGFTFDSNLSGGNYTWYNTADKAFPMWGETEPKTINELTEFNVVPLLRAIAKIDIGFNYTIHNDGSEQSAELLKNDEPYSLESLYLYRSNNQGRVVPDASSVSGSNGNIGVTAPSLVTGSAFNQPVLFEGLSTTKTVKETIYLAESAAGLPKDTESTTSLVLGIKHSSFSNTSSGSETNTRYFRADIQNEGETSTRAILRNHRYVVGIRGIKGEGSETPDEADKGSVEGKINVTITDWVFIDPDLTVNGEQQFSISQRNVELKNAGDSHTLIFDTNLPAGRVRLDTSELTSAFTVVLDFSTKRITVTANTSGTSIEETFHILAGEMKIAVTIRQGT